MLTMIISFPLPNIVVILTLITVIIPYCRYHKFSITLSMQIYNFDHNTLILEQRRIGMGTGQVMCGAWDWDWAGHVWSVGLGRGRSCVERGIGTGQVMCGAWDWDWVGHVWGVGLGRGRSCVERGIGTGQVMCGAWDWDGAGHVWSVGLGWSRSCVLVVDR